MVIMSVGCIPHDIAINPVKMGWLAAHNGKDIFVEITVGDRDSVCDFDTENTMTLNEALENCLGWDCVVVGGVEKPFCPDAFSIWKNDKDQWILFRSVPMWTAFGGDRIPFKSVKEKCRHSTLQEKKP